MPFVWLLCGIIKVILDRNHALDLYRLFLERNKVVKAAKKQNDIIISSWLKGHIKDVLWAVAEPKNPDCGAMGGLDCL